MATKMSFGNTATAIGAAVAAAIATSATFSASADSVEQRIGNEAALWLDASDISTITTNASGEVTRWDSRVGSNYAKQSTHFQGGAMPYPRYDATTYGIPTVDFGEAKTDDGWAGTNLGMDLRLNETVPTKTVFWVARMKDAGNVAWMGIQDFDSPFRRGGNGQYAMIPNAKFANFWNGQTVVADMANDHPPADEFCVYSAQMDDSATYNAEFLASHCWGLHSGGKQLSELIIFNQALSDGDRIEVTKYLQRKWANSRTVPIAHRWSFNGTTDVENLTDSVGGVVGKKKYKTSETTTVDGGTVNWSNGKAVLQGGAGTGHLNLGQGVLGTGNAVTLELWVTKDENVSGLSWGYFFSYNKPDTQNLLTLSSNHGSGSSNDRNMIQNSLNGGKFLGNEVDFTYLPKGETYHYAITFLADGNGGTIIRWIAHNAESGALVGDLTLTTTTWTLAANASDWSLTLGCNPWINSTYDNPSSYDEVRVWNGVLGDEQLKVNAMTGPDAVPDVAMTGSVGFALATNATFHVNSDYTTAGMVILGEDSKLQFSGPYVFTARGGISIPSGELADYVVADASLYNVIINDDVITVTCKAGSASWTGAGRAGDVTDPNNWDCRDGFDNVLPGELPSAVTAVTVSGAGINLQAPVGTTLQCASFTVRSCTFAADCDWRGLPVTPSFAGTVDLNGHDIRLGHLTANAGSALVNSGTGVSGVVFDATAGSYNESSYVDDVANLGTSENARIIIFRSDDDSVSTLNVGNTVGLWSEVCVTGGSFSSSANPSVVGNASSANGILTIDGGNVTLNSLKAQAAGNGTVNLRSGTLTVTGWTDYGNTSSGMATFNQSGGTLETRGNFWFGRSGSGTATFNMAAGSTFNLKGDFRLGSAGSSKGIFNQSGGTVNATGSNGINFGYDSNTWGKYYQTGGTFNTSRTINLRRAGSLLDIGGTVNATANGIGVNIATTSGSSGEVFIREGGVLNTSFLKKNTGTAFATFDGGTIVAHDENNAATFISGIGDVKYTAKGLTVDTNGKNVSMVNNSVSKVFPGSALVKQGAGTLTVDALPPVDRVTVSNGTLSVLADVDNRRPSDILAHRWSFTGGSLVDSVDGVAATVMPEENATVALAGDAVALSGDGHDKGYLDLGTELTTGNNATIEIWAKRTAVKFWARMFDYGPAAGNTLFFAWNRGNEARPNLKVSSDERLFTTNTDNLENDKMYHFVFVLSERADGKTDVKMTFRQVDDSSLVRTYEYTTSSEWVLSNVSSGHFYIGRSFYSGDSDANAVYDEVRIWNAALSDDAIAMSYEKGANATADDIAAITAKQLESNARVLELAGGTLALNSHILRQPVVKGGSGTVGGGLLDITDSLVVNLADCIAGNCITASGTIDFTGAKLVFEDPVVLETHKGAILFVRPAAGGGVTFVGSPVPAEPLPTGWKISISASGARLLKSGLSIHLK